MGGRGKSIRKKVKKRKVPELPSSVKEKLQKGKGDRISAKSLGLSVEKPGNLYKKQKVDKNNPAGFEKKSRTANKNLDISKLNLGGGNLSKKSLLGLESSLAGGFKKSNPKPITVAPIKGKPGQYAVLGNAGNNRIAYAKLSGYNGKVYVKVVSEGRRNRTFKQNAAIKAKKASKK